MNPPDDTLLTWLLGWLVMEGAASFTEGVVEEAHNAWKLHHWRMVNA